MSSSVALLFNDSGVGMTLYLLPASFLVTFDEFEVERKSKLPLSCSQNVLFAVVSQKLHHRHKPYKAQFHLRVSDVWPAALPCQMAYYTEQSPTAHYKTALLQLAQHRIYTHFVRSVKN